VQQDYSVPVLRRSLNNALESMQLQTDPRAARFQMAGPVLER